MTPPEPTAPKPPRLCPRRGCKMALLATLRASLSAKGTRAPSHRRTPLLASRLALKRSKGARSAPESCAAARMGYAALLTIAATAAFCAAPASAAVTHRFLPEPTAGFAAGVPAGQTVPGPLSGVNAFAADEGHLWVSERLEGGGGERIDEFNAASGAFEAQLPQVPGVSQFFQGVAVGHAAGEREVYAPGSEGEEATQHSVLAVFGAANTVQSVWQGALTANGSFTFNGASERAGEVTGVAVDGFPNTLTDSASGDVYVATAARGGETAFNVIDVFNPKEALTAGQETKPVAELTGTCATPTACSSERFSDPGGVAVSAFNGDVLVTDRVAGHGVIDIFEPTVLGEYKFLRQITGVPSGQFGELGAVAVDPANGEIYLADRPAEVVDQFSGEGAYLGRLEGSSEEAPFTGVSGLAVEGDVYVGDYGHQTGAIDVFGPDIPLPTVETGAPTAVGFFSAVLNGSIDPVAAGEASCRFAWGATRSFGHTLACASVPNGSGAVARSETLTGLQPDREYCYRLQSGNANGPNPGEAWQDHCFVTPGPGLDAVSTSNVSAESASFEATVNPHANPSSTYIEYGTSTEYGRTAPATPDQVGEGEEPVEVGPFHVQGLSPETTYYYRLVVQSEISGKLLTFPGAGHSFTTQRLTSVYAPPDAPRDELVSPPDKHGALISAISEDGIVQASRSGNAFTFLTNIPTEVGVKGYFEEVQVLAGRASNGGWSSTDIALPHVSATGASVGQGPEYRFFSEDLSEGLVEPLGEYTSLAPEVSPPDTERTPYVRHSSTCPQTPATCYEPLATSAPGYADIEETIHFGGNPSNEGSDVSFVGASPDLKHVILTSSIALTSAAPTSGALYGWSSEPSPTQRLQPVSVLPESEGGIVPANLGAPNGYTSFAPSARGAVSGDGSRVFWTADPGEPHLYMRDVSHGQTLVGGQEVPGETLRLDVPRPGAGAGVVAPRFQWADPSGRTVFFTDEQALTAGSGAGPGTRDLYECVIVEVGAADECVLHDLTPDVGGVHANVEGLTLGASSDGTTVYYVASGVLGGGVAASGEAAVPGGHNLYVQRLDSASGLWEEPTLVAVLSGDDIPDWGGPDEVPATSTAAVSGDGGFLVFMSDRSLTGYDNRDVVSGHPDEEVYQYDSAGGRVVCVSCNPTGARPHGIEYHPLEVGQDLVGGTRVWDGHVWLAANVPGWTPFEPTTARYQSRYLSPSGRVFFNSGDALVPQDVNNNQDVYEYAPLGVAGCTTSYRTYSTSAGGCVSLISSGTATGESAFLDAGESGNDVFFLTSAKLVPQDLDTALDVYDAHVCTTEAPCQSAVVPPPPCTTANACRTAPPAQPPIYGPPASSTFSGPGNPAPPPQSKPKTAEQVRVERLTKALKACRTKRNKHKRATCERAAHKKYAKKATAKRSAAAKARKR